MTPPLIPPATWRAYGPTSPFNIPGSRGIDFSGADWGKRLKVAA